MFERFTDRARRSLVLAESEAGNLNHQFIGTEHILLGLLAEGTGVAAVTLSELGLTIDRAREAIVETIGQSASSASGGRPPFTPRAKKVLELSLREALALRHSYIGTEHILLGLIREGDGVGAQVLIHEGIPLKTAREAVLSRLEKGSPAPGPSSLEATSRPAAGITPIARRIARERQGDDGRLSSHHFLLALFDDGESMAAKALAALEVSREKVEATLARLDLHETSDAPPKPIGSPAALELDLGRGMTLRIHDPQVAQRLVESRGDLSELADRFRDLSSRILGEDEPGQDQGAPADEGGASSA
jgi:ATP-dependent Clp protease ATP-binding subunit ClpA